MNAAVHALGLFELRAIPEQLRANGFRECMRHATGLYFLLLDEPQPLPSDDLRCVPALVMCTPMTPGRQAYGGILGAMSPSPGDVVIEVRDARTGYLTDDCLVSVAVLRFPPEVVRNGSHAENPFRLSLWGRAGDRSPRG